MFIISKKNIIILFIAIASFLNGDTHKFAGKLIDIGDIEINYGYAPSIIYEDGIFHMFFGSNGSETPQGHAWDYIRYSTSEDGRIWSTPEIILTVSDYVNERAACDPSVVHYNAGDGDYYYMFYSGNKLDVQTVVFVSRSVNIDGPYKKFTERNTWEIDPPDPKIIISPFVSIPDDAPGVWYGAGQQTVIAKDGKLYCWYTDTSKEYPTYEMNLCYTSTFDPTNWEVPQLTGLLNVSTVDIKYSSLTNEFIMFGIGGNHQESCFLEKRTSVDGIGWGGYEILATAEDFPDYAHNPGVSGDKYGHLIDNTTLMAYGAPVNLDSSYTNDFDLTLAPFCWAFWDIYGSVINPYGEIWSDIPWSWEFREMSHENCELIPGDYDGDGKTDRAMVDRAANPNKWYIYSSETGEQGVEGIPWGWEWAGMTADFKIVTNDYDGDGKTDRAIISPTNQWMILSSETGGAGVEGIPWTWQWEEFNENCELVLGDYDGDGKIDRAMVDRAVNPNKWYIYSSETGNQGVDGIPWGWEWAGMTADFKIVTNDYDGDGKTDRAIISPTNQWMILSSETGGAGVEGIPWTWQWEEFNENCELVLGDYDGDGKIDRAMVDRAVNPNKWYIYSSETGNQGVDGIPWGWEFDKMDETSQFVIGDYDGDDKADRAITNHYEGIYYTAGKWFILNSIPNEIYNPYNSNIIDEDNDQLSIVNYQLEQNYPNPFNPGTTIKFSLNNTTNVKLAVFNTKGEKVASLINGSLAHGAHSVNFNGANLNSGVYYYTLETPVKSITKKMILIK